MIDPRLPLADDDVPDLGTVTMAELRHWLNTDPRRWARAAAATWEDSNLDLADTLASWFAAAIEAGRMEAGRTRTPD